MTKHEFYHNEKSLMLLISFNPVTGKSKHRIMDYLEGEIMLGANKQNHQESFHTSIKNAAARLLCYNRQLPRGRQPKKIISTNKIMDKQNYRFPYTQKEFSNYLDEIGESLPDSDFIMQHKLHKRELGYGVLLRRYKPIEFEQKYNDWVESKKVKYEIS